MCARRLYLAILSTSAEISEKKRETCNVYTSIFHIDYNQSKNYLYWKSEHTSQHYKTLFALFYGCACARAPSALKFRYSYYIVSQNGMSKMEINIEIKVTKTEHKINRKQCGGWRLRQQDDDDDDVNWFASTLIKMRTTQKTTNTQNKKQK